MQHYICPKVAVYTQVVNPELQTYCYSMLTYNRPSNLVFNIWSLPCSLYLLLTFQPNMFYLYNTNIKCYKTTNQTLRANSMFMSLKVVSLDFEQHTNTLSCLYESRDWSPQVQPIPKASVKRDIYQEKVKLKYRVDCQGCTLETIQRISPVRGIHDYLFCKSTNPGSQNVPLINHPNPF